MEALGAVEVVEIGDVGSGEYKSIVELYEKMFPLEERNTLEQVTRLILRKIYTVLIIRHKSLGSLIGFAFVVFHDDPDFVFLDYMAIDPMFQYCGFGTLIFNSIMEMQKKSSWGILLEVEVPAPGVSNEQKLVCKKRKQFYQRLGCFCLDDIHYRLPRVNGEPIQMELMFKPASPIDVLPAEIINKMIGCMYDKVHSDVANRRDIFASFMPSIKDYSIT